MTHYLDPGYAVSYAESYADKTHSRPPARPAITGILHQMPARLPAPHVSQKEGVRVVVQASLKTLVQAGRAGERPDPFRVKKPAVKRTGEINWKVETELQNSKVNGKDSTTAWRARGGGSGAGRWPSVGQGAAAVCGQRHQRRELQYSSARGRRRLWCWRVSRGTVGAVAGVRDRRGSRLSGVRR